MYHIKPLEVQHVILTSPRLLLKIYKFTVRADLMLHVQCSIKKREL